MSINKVILIGNVGKDPEVRTVDSGAKVARFPLATSETYKNKSGDKVVNTEWHNIVMWRNLAEIAEKYVKKGIQIYVEGKLRTRSYEDKEKVKKYITEIEADTLKLLGKRSDEQAGHSHDESIPSDPINQEIPPAGKDDDLPF